MTRTDVPEFLVYGEPPRPVDLAFLHVEKVSDRSSVHAGSVTMHRHPGLAQITVWTRGSGRYRIEERELDFFLPAASFVPSGVVHGFEIAAGSDALVVSIADDLTQLLASRTDLDLSQPCFVHGKPEDPAWAQLAASVREIQREYRGQRGGVEKVLEALVSIALSAIHRLAGAEPARPASPAGALATRFRHLVDTLYRDDLKIQDYAERLGTTPYLLGKAVQDSLGTGLKEAILARRLLEAKRLLRFTVRSVEDIAFETGFRDGAYFSRFFHKRCGVSPVAWRRGGLAR